MSPSIGKSLIEEIFREIDANLESHHNNGINLITVNNDFMTIY